MKTKSSEKFKKPSINTEGTVTTMNNKVFQRNRHRQLWQWLADNPEKDKEDWVRWEFNGGDVGNVSSRCFACDYACGCGTGKGCPLEWSLGSCIENDESEYDLWRDSENLQERTRLALLIKELPVRDGVNWE